MNLTAASLVAFFTVVAPAVLAQTTNRNLSVPDANPACMERNGVDCVLKSDVVAPRVTAPPSGVTPPVTTTSPATPPTIIISPSATRPLSGATGGTASDTTATSTSPSNPASGSGSNTSTGQGGVSTPGTAPSGAGSVRR